VKRKILLEKAYFSICLNSWWQIHRASKRGDLVELPRRLLEPAARVLLRIWEFYSETFLVYSSNQPWSWVKVTILVSNILIKLASGSLRE
jgi:hypothetical protein